MCVCVFACLSAFACVCAQKLLCTLITINTKVTYVNSPYKTLSHSLNYLININ